MQSDDPREQWQRVAPVGVDADGEPLVRPATTLTGEGPALPREPRDRAAAADGAKAGDASAPAAVELPLEQRLDAYLLGRALREWADDEYLDRLGIDRVQVESWAHALDFEERIGAIRRLSYTLMQQQGALV